MTVIVSFLVGEYRGGRSAARLSPRGLAAGVDRLRGRCAVEIRMVYRHRGPVASKFCAIVDRLSGDGAAVQRSGIGYRATP